MALYYYGIIQLLIGAGIGWWAWGRDAHKYRLTSLAQLMVSEALQIHEQHPDQYNNYRHEAIRQLQRLRLTEYIPHLPEKT